MPKPQRNSVLRFRWPFYWEKKPSEGYILTSRLDHARPLMDALRREYGVQGWDAGPTVTGTFIKRGGDAQ